MTRYSNQWTALTVWAIAVGGAGAVMVPSVMSTSTLLVVAIGGPATVILMRTLRLVHDPASSFARQCATMEAADRRGAGAK